jgi:predicted RNA binding protein YcfA (HicA-like mRNA interferase family)
MKLPRDLTGHELARSLARIGYQITRQTGSHIRLTTNQGGKHHLTIPAHNPLKIGTLAAILTELQTHHKLDRDELLRGLFG